MLQFSAILATSNSVINIFFVPLRDYLSYARVEIITNIIVEYLKHNKRLCVPKLGTFIVKQSSGSIVFSDLMRGDDGVLRSLLVAYGMGELEATGKIDRFVFEIRHAIGQNESFILEGLGEFRAGDNNTITFIHKLEPRVVGGNIKPPVEVFNIEKLKLQLSAAPQNSTEAGVKSEKRRKTKAKAEEEKRIAAEKAAAEKAEKARLAAEAKAKAEEERRIAAEKAAAEKAEQARLAAEQKQQQLSANNAQVDAARLEKMAAQKAQKEAQLAKKQETIAKWKDAKLRGYGSFIDASWAIDSYSLMMSGGLHYIGGYHFNNCIYLGVGAGINLAQTYEWDGQESVLSPNAWNVPVYAHLRTNFVNRRCSPYFALSAGYQISTRREFPMPFEQSVYYKTSSIFVNPQLGINFRINPKNSIYVAVGVTLLQQPELVELTPMTATFGSQLGYGIDLHIGFTF